MNLRSQPTSADSSQNASRLRRRALGGYRYVRLRWRLLFGCLDAIGAAIFSIVRLFPSRNRDREGADDPEKILLVQFDHLGDALITTSMFGPLRRRFPSARIDVLAAPWNRAVFETVAGVHRVFVCRHNRFAACGGLAWIPATIGWGVWLRKRSYDLVIDVRGEFPHNVLLWLTGAPRRLGWASGGGGFLLTDIPEFVVNRPEIQSRAALLECLGISCRDRIQPTFCPGRAATETAEAAWREVDPHAERARTVLHIGAGTSAKRWPAEHWRGLINQLTGEGNVAVTLVGTLSDKATARAILGTSASRRVADWTGRFTVDELAAVLQQANVFVGADSGPAHLAAAVGTAVVALFSGTNSLEQWQPQGPLVRSLRHDVPCSPCHRKTCPIVEHPCMRGIRPSDVIETLAGLVQDRIPRDDPARSRQTKGSVS